MADKYSLEENEFIVDTILDQRNCNGKFEYLISWKGFGPEENSWEPEDNLDCPDKLVRFALKRSFLENSKLKEESRKRKCNQNGNAMWSEGV